MRRNVQHTNLTMFDRTEYTINSEIRPTLPCNVCGGATKIVGKSQFSARVNPWMVNDQMMFRCVSMCTTKSSDIGWLNVSSGVVRWPVAKGWA